MTKILRPLTTVDTLLSTERTTQIKSQGDGAVRQQNEDTDLVGFNVVRFF